MEENVIYAVDDDTKLSELIESDTLQKLQDACTISSGIAAQIVSIDGEVLTKSKKLETLRMQNDENTAVECLKDIAQSGDESYHLVNNVVFFSVPIVVGERRLGDFLCGCEATDDSKITLKKARRSIERLSSALSDIAYKSFELKKTNHEVENASKLKSDFLANMSHEIRTPMNAVLGMVDLALREEMTPGAREYVEQIKTAGKNLLAIINDILDFSKIEAGKMDINSDEYELIPLINGIENLISANIGDKEIDFTLSIDPDIPKRLFGDAKHIHQIMVNILNNAVKFTRKGNVDFHIYCEYGKNNEVTLCAVIKDTGIGIKDEDKNKLFVSFQQLDSKRNRNVEGTGLGLAITHRLLDLMGGTISFESQYKKGSTFYINIPQKMIERMASVPALKKSMTAALKLESVYIREQIKLDLERVGINCTEISDISEVENDKPDFLIAEKNDFTDEVICYFETHTDIFCLALAEFSSRSSNLLPNVHIIKKPVYSLMLYNALGISDIELYKDTSASENVNFVAPSAKVLIVDDNEVNLAVAKGILEPLKMDVNIANNAGLAIAMMDEKQYDLIFMDHMMPEVDGVEATHIIRRLMPEYDAVPIIALTANAVRGAKEMLIAEGMTDFVAKPIDAKIIFGMVYKWLPEDKIVPVNPEDMEKEKSSSNDDIAIEGLDIDTALSRLGSKQLFMTVLNEYYQAIDHKYELIQRHLDEGDIHNYTIEVHSLKSTSRQIGAMELGDLAFELEKAGKSNDIEYINNNNAAVLEMYMALKEKLAPYVTVKEKTEHKAASNDEILSIFDDLNEALESFDTLMIDELVGKLGEYDYPDDKQTGYLEELRSAAEICDIDSIGNIISKWKETIGA